MLGGVSVDYFGELRGIFSKEETMPLTARPSKCGYEGRGVLADEDGVDVQVCDQGEEEGERETSSLLMALIIKTIKFLARAFYWLYS